MCIGAQLVWFRSLELLRFLIETIAIFSCHRSNKLVTVYEAETAAHQKKIEKNRNYHLKSQRRLVIKSILMEFPIKRFPPYKSLRGPEILFTWQIER